MGGSSGGFKMDIKVIVSKLWALFPATLIVALIMIGVWYVSYAIYRRRGGGKSVTKMQFGALFLLLGWIVVVMTLTTFSRGPNFEGWVNLRLLSGYVSAWHQWSLSEWQLIIFNMIMFAPLGFLLPLLSKRTRRFLTVLCLSFLVAMGIEFVQVISRRGIFELDDLFHNTLGSIAGFLLMRAVLDSAEHRRLVGKSIVMGLAIPLTFVLLYSGAMLVYHSKELGNLSIRPSIPQNMERVDITLTTDLPTSAEPVSLYYSDQIHSLSYGKEIAELIGHTFDLQRKGSVRVDGPNRMWPFLDHVGNEFAVIYNLNTGGWSLYTEADLASPTDEEELMRYKEHYESWMLSSGLMPVDASFNTQDGNTLRWAKEQMVSDIAQGTSDYVDGFIMLIPSTAYEIPQDLFFTMKENQFVRKVDLISPAEAYNKILKGEFSIYNNLESGDNLQVTDYELVYMYDSKGYYQPVYMFVAMINGQDWQPFIPAVRR